MKKVVSLLSVLAVFALVSLTSCEKVKGDAEKFVGSWSVTKFEVDGETLTAEQFRVFLDQLPEGELKNQLTHLMDMKFTLNNNYKFNGTNLPEPGYPMTFGGHSGKWSYDSYGPSIVMIDEGAGIQWTFDVFEDGTIGKANGNAKFILTK